MSFLDKDKIWQKEEAIRLAAEEESALRANEEVIRKVIEEASQRQKALEDSHRLATEDQAALLELMSNLPPDFNFKKYLDTVKRHSGFDYSIALYTRTYEKEGWSHLTGISDEVRDSLASKGIKFAMESGYPGALPPTEVFHGDKVRPKRFFRDLVEPQKPGIGIRFRQEVEQAKFYKNADYMDEMATTITGSNLYLRLFTPRTALITGYGNSVDITSLEALDAGLSKNFGKTHRTVSVRKSIVSSSPHDGPGTYG